MENLKLVIVMGMILAHQEIRTYKWINAYKMLAKKLKTIWNM